MFLAGDFATARQLMDELARRQESDGHVSGATTSVVGSEGDSLIIETTSLAALAWLRDPAFADHAARAMEYLAGACQGGRYGSTQSTVLALRAIVAYDKARAHPTAPGSVQLYVDDKPVGSPVAFDASTQGALLLPEFAGQMTPGKHDVELRMTDGSSMPYALDVTYHSRTPASSEVCKVGIEVTLADAQLTEGSPTAADVVVTNRTSDCVPTPIAIVGLPGGLEPRYDQLKELVKSQRIAAYEVRSREVILYWRDLQPNQRVEIPLSLTAAVPGDFTGPASRAYLYYADENKQWVEGLKVSIVAR
jgi:alpha-2-macroglobulin-like protein